MALVVIHMVFAAAQRSAGVLGHGVTWSCWTQCQPGYPAVACLRVIGGCVPRGYGEDGWSAHGVTRVDEAVHEPFLRLCKSWKMVQLLAVPRSAACVRAATRRLGDCGRCPAGYGHAHGILLDGEVAGC